MFKKMIQFFKEVKNELKKVSWPGRREVINSTIVVLIATAVITLFLYLVDVGLSKLVGMVIK
ncbi:MAG: preprotein translocase subunit SecE [bacterium]